MAGWRVYGGVRPTRRPRRAPGGRASSRSSSTSRTASRSLRRRSQSAPELHGLVDNAGIAVAAPLGLVPLDELRRQLEVNVVGQVAVLQAFLPALRRRRGRVVLMGSVGGRSALPFLGPYAASKHALEAFADVLRIELAPVGGSRCPSSSRRASRHSAIWDQGRRGRAEAMRERARRRRGQICTRRAIARFRQVALEARSPGSTRTSSRRRSSTRSPPRDRRRATSSAATRTSAPGSSGCRRASATAFSRRS